MTSLGDAIVYGLGMATIFLGLGCLVLLLAGCLMAAHDEGDVDD